MIDQREELTMQQALGELARFRLDGRVAVVSGGSGGIGARLCAALGGVGARLVVIGRDADRASQALDDAGGDGIAVSADVTIKADADRAIDAAMQAFGRVDVIVNAVGGGAGGALYPAEEYPESEWDRMLDLNLRSALLPTQAAVRAMIAGGNGGRVLHLSSVRGQLGIDNGFSAYVAAKGALDALTRQQATEWAKHDITVNAISPTFVAHAAGRGPARRRRIPRGPLQADPARPDRRDRRRRRRRAPAHQRRVGVHHRPGAHP